MFLPQAKWIAAPFAAFTFARDAADALPSPLFRKEFELNGVPREAVLSVCGLGFGVVTINGRPVTGDVLTTPFTKYDATVLYRTYEVAGLLHAGTNAIGVMLGNGWYNDITDHWDFEKASWRHHPKLILSLQLAFDGGEAQAVVSDSSWKTHPGPVVFNHVRCGDRYDAQRVQNGFDRPGYEDGGWESAFVCRGPGGILKEAKLPPVRITRTPPMDEIFPHVYDARQNLSGWAKIRVRGPAGQRISLRYAERVKPDGTLDTEHINQYLHAELVHCDEYICAGNGRWEEWEPCFCYHGFRYVAVSGAPEDFAIEARVVHTDLPSVGEFSCSDDLLNQIHSACRQSTLTNFVSVPTDCPHREQNGWTGDALLSCEQALMNFDMNAAYAKWLNDFRDVQRPSGQLPGIIPTGGWGFNWGSGPAWDSALILIPLYVYRYTKDDGLLREMWDCMERYLSFLSTMEEDGIVAFGLGDWCAPAGTVPCPAALTDTAYYYADAVAMAEGAHILGKDDAPYRALADRIRRAFRSRFLKNGLPDPLGQTSLACALFQGLLEPGETARAAARLDALVRENGDHIDCGILGAKYIFRALSDHGYAETLYRMVTNPTCPSYACWMRNGMTTLCEDWEMKKSLNHHMFSEVDLWFYRYIAGIRCDGEALVIAPVFLNALDWVRASHRGISVCWDRSRIRVTVPRPATLIFDGRTIPLPAGESVFDRAVH